MELSDTQARAADHIRTSLFQGRINPICALDMGLGKTRVACEIISDIIKENHNFKIMIIHKASNYRDPWHNELAKCGIIDKNYDSIYLHGKERNEHLFSSDNKYHFNRGVIIQTTYDTAAIDINEERYDKSLIFDLLIFDEIHTIANHKRLTRKIKALASLKAKYKLALTGTPIQNNNNELGLIYLFLNKPNLFSCLFLSYGGQNRKRQQLIIEIAVKTCLKKKALFRVESLNRAITKDVKILSLPIDDDMLKFIRGELKNHPQKKMMYLSNPKAVYFKNGKNKTTPYCTKEAAVKMILQRMLDDEKAIIFSLYIDVLGAYYEVCKAMGIPALIITGKEKGKALEENLNLFGHQAHFRVLLTTLQKSSEGLNLDIANHIIILEFWWNPQKMFQAMSRVDRINQKRDIFIYMLCYHDGGEIIDEEKIFFETMNRKFENAKTLYQENNKNIVMYDEYGDEKETLYKKMPDKITFKEKDELRFLPELAEFLSIYRNEELPPSPVMESAGIPLHETKKQIAGVMNEHLRYCGMVSSYPWRIELQELEDHFLNYYQVMLSHPDITSRINDRLRIPGDIWADRPVDSFYPVVFADFNRRSVKDGNNKEHHLFIVVGINKNGMKELLGIWNPSHNVFERAFDNLKQKGLNSILITVVNDRDAGEKIKGVYPDTQMLLSFYYFIAIGCKKIGFRHLDKELEKIEEIFFASSKEQAHDICDKYIAQKEIFLLLAKKNIQDIESYFCFSPETRRVIASTGIIRHLELVIRAAMGKMAPFYSIAELLRFFYAVSDHVLPEKWFEPLPDWANIMKELKAFSGGRIPS
jgi:transposase-like protein/superfamily II DNA or RNA helicase